MPDQRLTPQEELYAQRLETKQLERLDSWGVRIWRYFIYSLMVVMAVGLLVYRSWFYKEDIVLTATASVVATALLMYWRQSRIDRSKFRRDKAPIIPVAHRPPSPGYHPPGSKPAAGKIAPPPPSPSGTGQGS